MRTFLALEIDEPTRRRLLEARRRLDVGGAKIRWVAPENLHVTLRFLGEVRDVDLARLCEMSAEAAAGIEPFDFTVRGLKCVPPRGPLRMIWAGVDDATSRMGELHARLTEALAGAGFPPDGRAFKPHITMARVKFARNADAVRSQAAPLADEPFGAIRAAEVVTFTSELTPHGPIYTPAARARLGPRR